MLTTTQAAKLASVAPSTIKRWADQGLLPVVRTAGGHRRFERAAVERFLREQAVPDEPGDEDPLMEEWLRCLLDGRRHEVDGALLKARARRGSWYGVADELGEVLGELGQRWAEGGLGIVQEHTASNALTRGLHRVCDALPTNVDGPRCALACLEGEEHTLGLGLAEVCLCEQGWTPIWVGRRTPVSELVRMVKGGGLSMVALSASISSSDAATLLEAAVRVGQVCAERGVGLVLGGAGAWPERLKYGVRLTSFQMFHEHLVQQERG